MSGENLRHRGREFWGEFRQDRAGLVGVGLLAPVPLPAGLRAAASCRSPRAARAGTTSPTGRTTRPAPPPPGRTGSARRRARCADVIREAETSTEESDGVRLVRRSFAYEYAYDVPPLDVVARFTATGDVPTALTVSRPDGIELELFSEQFTAGDQEHVRISVDRASQQRRVRLPEAVRERGDVGPHRHHAAGPHVRHLRGGRRRHGRGPAAAARQVRLHAHHDAAGRGPGRGRSVPRHLGPGLGPPGHRQLQARPVDAASWPG